MSGREREDQPWASAEETCERGELDCERTPTSVEGEEARKRRWE